MSRLNTLYPNDEFLKNISNMFGKVDSKSEIEIKQEIEQIGYKEFYRYYNEKGVYIKQLQQENKQLKDNWNKLKDYIVKEYYMYLPLEASTRSITILIDKMQELEQGSNSNDSNR